MEPAKNGLGRVGVIGRWKPFHNGGAVMLEEICRRADQVVIGLGSCNKYNLRNPFTAEESERMIDAFLSGKFSNYSFIQVPDFAHIPEYSDGKKWKEYVAENFGALDAFITGNEYVAGLLKDVYEIRHPAEFIPQERWTRVKGTQARVEMAKGDGWKSLVPAQTAAYLEGSGLVGRFRKEFGLETIAEYSASDFCRNETAVEESDHAKEV